MNICFIYVSEDTEYSISAPALPVGLISLANFIKREGFPTEIIHLTLEQKLNPGFDIIQYLKHNNYEIVCLSLHWHTQSSPVLKLINKIKTYLKNIKIVLGGYTASFFAQEIMQNHSEIDFVIKGDAEVPLTELIKAIKKKTSTFETLPNLMWRKNTHIISNQQSYVADEKILNQLCFTDFQLVKNYNKYLDLISVDKIADKKETTFHFVLGRGCNMNCSYCGGSKTSQKIMNNRKHITLMDTQKIIATLKEVQKNNFDRIRLSFDPILNQNYFIEIFREIRNNELKFTVDFEVFKLPTKEFIDEFKKTFSKDSYIILSPESGSEKIRKLNKGYYYTNKQLIQFLHYLKEKQINVLLSFTAGLPFEQKTNIKKTMFLLKHLRNNFDNIKYALDPLILDPASPMYLNPKKYDIILHKKSFEDFSKRLQKEDIGYRTKFLSQEEIKKVIKKYRETVED